MPRRQPSQSALLARQLAALREMAAAGAVADPYDLARITVRHVRDLLAVDTATVRWWDPAGGRLVALARSRAARSSAPALKPGQGASGMAFQTRRPQVVEDYANWDRAHRGRVRAGVRSVAAAPLLVQDQCVGVLAIGSLSPRAFDSSEVELLELMAAQVAPALNRATLLADKEIQRRRLEALHKVMVAAAGVLDPSSLAVIVAGMAAEVLGTDFARVTAFDESSGRLRVIGTSDPNPIGALEFEVGSAGGVMGLAFETRTPVAIEDYPRSAVALDWAVTAGYESILAVPMMVRDRAIGGLAVLSLSRRRFSAEDVQVLSLLGAQVAPVIEAARAHGEMLAYRRRLELILASAPLILFTLDGRARFTFLEGRSVHSLGIDPAGLRGKSVFELWPGNAALLEGVRSALAGREAALELSSPRSGIDLEVELRPLLAGDGPAGVIGVAMDVTERRRAREADRESEAQSRFLAAMSHELRTPLNSILGFAQLLALQNFGPERRERYVDNILQSGRHLLDLINAVLDLSKVKAGHIDLSIGEVDVAAVATSAVGQLQPIAQESGLRLSAACPPGLVCEADGQRLLQVLLNLLSNALEFTPPGGAVTVVGEADGPTVRIRVKDTGIGIAPDDQARIFDEFVQVEAGVTRRHPGTGLGLALSRRLMAAMGGELLLASRLGAGSEFTAVLPRAQRGGATRGRSGRRSPRRSEQGRDPGGPLPLS